MLKLVYSLKHGRIVAVIVPVEDIQVGTSLTLAYGPGYWSYALRKYAFNEIDSLVINKYLLNFPPRDDADDNDNDNDV